jgi:hypothetical protein
MWGQSEKLQKNMPGKRKILKAFPYVHFGKHIPFSLTLSSSLLSTIED